MREKYKVSEERLEALKAILADPHRENEEGETVAVRQKSKEATAEDLAKLWDNIKKSALFDVRSDGSRYLDRNGFQLETLRAYLCERFKLKADDIPHALSMTQLKKIQNWISTEDEAVIARCQELQRETDTLTDARKKCAHWHEAVIHAFDETLNPTPGNAYTPARTACLRSFKKVVKERFDGFDFESQHSATTLDALLDIQ